MFGYYTSLLKTYTKKISIYILLAVFFVVFALLSVLIYFTQLTEAKETIYLSLTAGITFIFIIIFWFIFYNNIYRTLIGSNLELLSFTTGLSRTKIFFSKFFVFLTLSFALSCYMTIILLVPTIFVYGMNHSKILYLIIGTILMGTFGSLTFYFFALFADTLSKNAKRKRSLVWVPLTSLFMIFGINLVASPFIETLLKNPYYIGKGYGDYQYKQFFDKNMENSHNLSISENAYYTDNEKNSFMQVPRDVEFYNGKTATFKAIGIFTNYLNFQNVLSTAQGIGRVRSDEDKNSLYSLFDNRLYHHYKGIDKNNIDKLASLNYKSDGRAKKILFNKIELNKILLNLPIDKENEKFFENILKDEIDKIADKLKNNDEFSKNEPNFEIIYKFLKNEIFTASLNIISEFKKKYGQLNVDQININFIQSNLDWIVGYIYLKAKPENKTLVFDYLPSKNKDEFFDASGNVYKRPEFVGETNGVTNEERETFKKQSKEFDEKLEKSFAASKFLNYFTDPDEILFSRDLTSDYEFPWISWLLIAVIILGMGYWSLHRYNKKDVA